jgi:hypothetical protein
MAMTQTREELSPKQIRNQQFNKYFAATRKLCLPVQQDFSPEPSGV